MYNMCDADNKSSSQCFTYEGMDVVPVKAKDHTSAVEMRIKRPMNAFMIWSVERRKRLHLECPKMHHSEISKRLGAEWKLLTDVQKKPFVDQSKRLRAEHQNEYPDYKYKPKRKPKKEHCSPMSRKSNARDEKPFASSTENGPSPDPLAYMNGWPNGAFAVMPEQLGYVQYPGTNRLIQQMHRYDMNALQYSHMLPTSQAYMNAAYSYNAAPNYNQQISTSMSLGTAEPRENVYPKTSFVPHAERVSLEDPREMIMYIPVADDARKPFFLQNISGHNIQPNDHVGDDQD